MCECPQTVDRLNPPQPDQRVRTWFRNDFGCNGWEGKDEAESLGGKPDEEVESEELVSTNLPHVGHLSVISFPPG